MPTTLTPDQRAERLNIALEEIAVAVERLAAGPEWQAWLAVAARLGRARRYSARNTMWLWQQALTRGTELSVLGGYRWWQQAGRQVAAANAPTRSSPPSPAR